MEHVYASLAIGLALGAVACYLVMRGKISATAERTRSHYQSERTTLNSKLEERQRSIPRLNRSFH